MYIYSGRVISVYDADTFTIEFDLGFNIKFTEPCRLYGIDTPELRTKNLKEKTAGYKARDLVRELILDKTLTFETHKDKKGKFGRYLVDVILPGGQSLADKLIEDGLGYAYFGGKKRKWPS